MENEYPHLLAKTARLVTLSDADRIVHIRQPRWIGYPRAKEVLAKLEELFDYPKSHRMPNCLVVGDTNNGKTMLVRKFVDLHKPDDNPSGDAAVVPVLYIQAPPIPDEGRFYNAILDSLFAPYQARDRADRKQYQVIKLMKALGVKMLLIDEIHHLLAGNLTKQKAFLNVIKYLGNELEIPIVGVGTRDAFRAIQTDPQLANRFEPEMLPRWRNDDEYLQLLATFEKILPLKNPSFLTDVQLADMIFSMTEGYLGEICRLLVSAGVEAIRSRQECITSDVLRQLSWIAPSERRQEPRM